MKRTQWKDALRNIWKQKISFLSIVVIAALGVTIFLGIDFSADAIRKNGTAFYADAQFRDAEVASTLLLSEKDLKEIRSLDGVTDVEGVYLTAGKVRSNELRTDVNVISLTERINLPVVQEGRLPERNSECAVEQRLMAKMGWTVGDVITITNAADGKPEYLQNATFTISASITHPDHICSSIPETLYILVTQDAFDTGALNGCYMKAEVLIDRAPDLIRYGDAYRAAVKPVSERIEALAKIRAPIQEASAKAHANELLEKNRQTLADAQQKLADSRTELDDGWTALSDGEQQYADGKQQLEDGRRQLDESKQKLSDAEEKRKEGRAELDAAKAQLEDGAAKLEEGKKALDAASWELVSGWNTIEDAKTQIRSSLKTALDDLFGEDSAQWIAWAAPMEANPNSEDIAAGDFRITDGFQVTLGASLSDKIGTILSAADISDEVLRKVFEGLGGEGDYDREAAQKLLSDWLASMAGKVQQDYDALAEGCSRWDNGHRSYLGGLRQYRASLKQYNEGLAAYEAGEAQYAEGLKELEDGQNAYRDGEAQYAKSATDLEQARRDLDAARIQLEDGEQQYEDGLSQYNDGMEAFEDAEKQIESLGPCKWIVLDCYGNAGFVQLGTAANNLKSMEMTFALLFVLVGALVIYATVSKMVDEQRRQIGTTKALGFFNREIFAKYLLFGVSATLIGCSIGLLLARVGIQSIILGGYGMYFDPPLTKPSLVALSTVIVFAAGNLLAFFAILFACFRLLRAPAVKLMQPAMPRGRNKAASKTSARSLYARLILLNIRSDLRRVLVTVVSVAGCCALVVIGVTLRSAVQNAPVRQQREVLHYDGMVLFDPETDEQTSQRVKTVLQDAGAAACPIRRTNITIRIKDLNLQELYVGDLENVGEMIGLNDARSGKKLEPTDDGILISKRFSELYGLKKGDRIEIALNGTESATVPVAGIFNNFIGRSTYMSAACYQNLFGREAEPNAYLTRLDGAPLEPLLDALGTVRGYESYQPSDSFRELFQAATGVMNMIVLLFIFMSAVMAGVVLMNLTNIYILQKLRELTIMRINGFTTKEVIGYCLRETVVTTAIGIVLGIGLGAWIGYQIVRSLEQSFMQLDRSVSVLAWLIGAALTAAFAVIVNAIALKKVKTLKLTDLS